MDNRSRWGQLALACAFAVVLSACGGGGGSVPTASPGIEIIGTAGGIVRAEDGAQVVFPKDALRIDATVRIAKDSTGAPPLPPAAKALSAVYAITPHGGAFDEHVEVSIPVDLSDPASGGQLLLVTAKPGDTQWTVLSGATYHDGKMRAPVMHFSFFRVITLVNQIMPVLVTTIDGKNNIGADGATVISTDYEILWNSGINEYGYSTLIARLRYPQPVAPLALSAGALPPPPAPACMPLSLGHGGAEWRFLRNASEFVTPQTVHWAYLRRDESVYPRFESEYFGADIRGQLMIGFGALHFYGQDSPRRGDYGVPADPNASFDVWALPPANNATGEDLYTWRGETQFVAEKHNGRMRIDVTIPTDCGLFIEATPLAFRLNLVSTRGSFRGVYGLTNADVASGSDAVLEFAEEEFGSTSSIRWEYSTDPVNWQGLPVPAAWVTGPKEVISDPFTFAARGEYEMVIQKVQPAQAGYYRAYACAAYQPTLCRGSTPARLAVHTETPKFTGQPAGQVVQAGETASFTVVPGGAPVPALQWQKRSLAAAAFDVGAWVSIEGATGTTYTTSASVLGDNGTQYRAVAQNALGSAISDLAILTVVEQIGPPVIQSQPGNLNISVGGTAVFAATVSGTGPLSYQWLRDGRSVIGANSPILTLSNVSALNEGSYQLTVTNHAGTVTSEPAVLVVTLGTSLPLPPTIAAPPVSITVAEGNAANFAVAVNGTGPYSYLWMKNDVQAPIPNGGSPSFGIASVTVADAGTYSVRVTNSVGTIVSAAATLTVVPGTGVLLAPTITTAPVGLAVLPGGGATFAVAVTGTGPFAYQWRHNGTDLVSATSAVLQIATVTALDAGQYAVEIRNAAGWASSSPVPLIVVGAPLITQQPAAASATEGTTVTFSVAASGDGLLYQWMRNQVAIGGATSSSYATPALTLADSGAVYSVIVYNGAGLVFSQGAMLTVTAPTGFPANAIAFSASDEVNGTELWMTDGTTTGTVMVKDIYPGVDGSGPQSITRFGNLVVFRAYDAVNGRQTLWRSDGTAAGTVMLANLNFPTNLIVCNASLFFAARDASGNALWKTDGTSVGTVRLASISVTTDITQTVACANRVLFASASDSVHGTELWRSDGSVAGTTLVRDILAGPDGSNPSELVEFIGQLYFKANGALWRSDGTTDGTTMVSSDGFDPSHLTVNGSTLYFNARTAIAGNEPWKSDGTPAGTTMIKDLNVGTTSSYPFRFTVSAGITYFAAEKFSGSVQLWRTDGTEAGTFIVKQINPGLVASFGDGMIDVGGELYFYANDSATGSELWRTDGTDSGTVLVKDIFLGMDIYGRAFSSAPTSFMKLGNTLLFSASMSGIGTELWRTDGSEVGTVLVKDICAGTCSGNPVP